MHGVFGLRITLGRPFPGSLPVVLPTSSPSPLRNSPGFPPGSPRPHRGRSMHVTHVSTCDTQIATRRPPAPCRSRPISPVSQARRARGTLQHVDLGVRPGRYLAPPWHIGSKSHPVPHHVADTTASNTSATGTSSTWNAPARGPGGAAGAVLRTPVVFRFDKAPRATPRGKPHGLKHICHRIAGPRPARQTGSPPHPGPRVLSFALQNLQCK